MPAALPADQEPESKPREDESTSFGAWTLVWVIYLTKFITIVLVVWAAHSYEAATFVTITTWFWLGPMVALGAAPIAYRIRLRRVRRRRALLVQSEWNVGSSSPLADPAPRRTFRGLASGGFRGKH